MFRRSFRARCSVRSSASDTAEAAEAESFIILHREVSAGKNVLVRRRPDHKRGMVSSRAFNYLHTYTIYTNMTVVYDGHSHEQSSRI